MTIIKAIHKKLLIYEYKKNQIKNEWHNTIIYQNLLSNILQITYHHYIDLLVNKLHIQKLLNSIITYKKHRLFCSRRYKVEDINV